MGNVYIVFLFRCCTNEQPVVSLLNARYQNLRMLKSNT